MPIAPFAVGRYKLQFGKLLTSMSLGNGSPSSLHLFFIHSDCARPFHGAKGLGGYDDDIRGAFLMDVVPIDLLLKFFDVRHSWSQLSGEIHCFAQLICLAFDSDGSLALFMLEDKVAGEIIEGESVDTTGQPDASD
jgi:hypothetical protein